MSRAVLLAFLFASVEAPILAQTAADLEGFVDPFLRDQIEQRRIAGAVISVVKDGQVVFTRGYGRADVAAGRPMSPDTPVRIGSITKTLTALSVMQLVEAGALDLDRDVNEYLDFVIPADERPPVTLRRLLTHRTGFENRTAGIGAVAGERLSLGAFLARRIPPRLDQPDDVVAYSNYNAALAAYVVERASGQRFEQYVEDHIFAPLQMAGTTAQQPPPDTVRARLSNGYVRSDLPPTWVSMASATIHEVGSTGVCTTAADMARLMLELLEDSPRTVTRVTLEAMRAPHARSVRGVVGLGFFSPAGAARGNTFVGHDGRTGGFLSTLALDPKRRLGLFASYNSEGVPRSTTPTEELLQRVAERYFADVALPSSSSVSDVGGVYQPAAGVDSDLFALGRLFSQVAVRSAAGGLTIRPAVLPFGEPLDEIEPGLYRWSGRDVSFAGSGPSTMLQLGSPVAVFLRVPWWASASLVVPTLAVCLTIAALAVVWWPFMALRSGVMGLDPMSRRLKSATRLALLLNLLAIVGALWLVLWGWPLAAVSSAGIAPLVVAIYCAAWPAVLLAPLAVMHAVRLVRSGAVSAWASVRECVLVVVLVVLTSFCMYWRIAGTSMVP